MYGRPFTLFKISGLPIRIDASWLFLFLLIAWSLARGFFPIRYEDLPRETYWAMGIAGAIGLFISILLHELCHCMVARKFGIPISGITLFIFGGVSEMTDEPPSARAEFLMAIVGPLASAGLGLCLWGLAIAGLDSQWPVALRGVIGYLAWINFIVAGFNLLPAFPLDGGRVLRSALWRWRKDLQWATRIAAQLGTVFAILLSLWGIIRVLWLGDFIGGIWYVIIGIFLRSASQMSYQQVLMRRAFAGVPVRRFLQPSPVTVPPALSIDQFVEDYLYRYHFSAFPVVDGERLVGCITVEQVRQVPRAEWGQLSVGEITAACTPDNRIEPDAEVVKAISIMTQTQTDRLMVAQGEHLLGVITLQDLLHVFSVQKELDAAGQPLPSSPTHAASHAG